MSRRGSFMDRAILDEIAQNLSGPFMDLPALIIFHAGRGAPIRCCALIALEEPASFDPVDLANPLVSIFVSSI